MIAVQQNIIRDSQSKSRTLFSTWEEGTWINFPKRSHTIAKITYDIYENFWIDFLAGIHHSWFFFLHLQAVTTVISYTLKPFSVESFFILCHIPHNPTINPVCSKYWMWSQYISCSAHTNNQFCQPISATMFCRFTFLSCSGHHTTNSPIYEFFYWSIYDVFFSADFLHWNQPTFAKS